MNDDKYNQPYVSSDPRRTHKSRHILTNTVGLTADVEVDTAVRRVQSGSHLLLCTDGLWEYVEDDEFHEIVNNAATPQAACDTLVALAKSRGGGDNITVIVVRVP